MTPGGGPPDLLVVAAAEATMTGLISALADQGIHSDVALSLEEARHVFFARGGHSALVLAPDLVPAVARRVLDSLIAVDPGLAVVAFSRDRRQAAQVPPHVKRVGYHPASRAAVGAVLKALRGER